MAFDGRYPDIGNLQISCHLPEKSLGIIYYVNTNGYDIFFLAEGNILGKPGISRVPERQKFNIS
jgi:hypothetical protein